MRAHLLILMLLPAGAAWGPSKLLGGGGAPSGERPRSKDAPWHNLECATVANSKWQRLLCFGPLVELAPTGDAPTLLLNITVTVQPLQPAGADMAPSCGDSLDVRFTSSRALFAPLSVREVECGVHALRLVLPPDAPAWEAELYVVHIAGEGLADPPVPRPFPANLVNFNDGPPIYNLRAPVEGHLHAADWYVSPGSLAGSDAYAPHSAQGIPPRRPSSDAVLPLCGSGDHAGRWVFHHSLYPDVFGEPLQWRPLGCRYERISGARLRQCLDQPGLGNVQLAGESTLGQSFELLLAHMNASNYYWPARILEPAARLLWAHPRLRSAGLASEYHGIDQMLAHTLGDLKSWKPDVLVMLQGANDAARDSVAAFSTRLEAFLQALKEAIDAGEIAPRRLVWATAPIRSYKTGGLPGRLSCPEGTPESCLAVSGGSSVLIDGTLQWVQRPSDVKPLQFYGTIDRRRSLNRIAVERVKALFPTALILDYEALTAGLPSDYCIDGEHWGCPHVAWNGRFREAYQCRSLGNIVFSNILSNLICSTPRAAAAAARVRAQQ